MHNFLHFAAIRASGPVRPASRCVPPTDDWRTPFVKSPFVLAACAEMLWPDRPMPWRLSGLTKMRFEVGIWNWPNHDLD